jgi:hypothetical protein
MRCSLPFPFLYSEKEEKFSQDNQKGILFEIWNIFEGKADEHSRKECSLSVSSS